MRQSQRLMDGLPAEVLSTIIMNYVPRILFDILICLFPDLFPAPSHGGFSLVFWVLLEINGFPQSCPAELGQPWHSLTAFLFHSGGGLHCQIVHTHAMLSWQRGGVGKVPLTVFIAPKLLFFCSSSMLEFSLGKTGRQEGFCKFSLICEYLSNLCTLGFFPVEVRQVRAGLLAVLVTHPISGSICLYMWMHELVRLHLGHLAYVAESHNSHKGIYVHG